LSGAAGSSGATGAKGADGSINAHNAQWLNLTLGVSVTVPGLSTDVWPACFPDINGQVFLRGHVTLSPVPAVGGCMVGLFPQDVSGVCACTPKPDSGTESNSVIVTTTAMAYPVDNPEVAEVCIVRLLISQFLPPDVNRDFVINNTDLTLIYKSTYYNVDPTEESKCPLISDKRVCGPADVNEDGKVNVLDATSVTQSTLLGTNVACGGVYVTAFSCGSTKSTPLTPAADISLDSMFWFNDDGQRGAVKPLTNTFGRRQDNSLLSTMLDQFQAMQDRFVQLEGSLELVDNEFGSVRSKFGQVDKKLGQHDSELVKIKSKARRAGTEILSEVVVSGLVVLATVIIVAVVRKFKDKHVK
jgi:hypothetical protein